MPEWRVRAVLVGAGPGRPDLITLRGREWIGRADVILYDRLIDPRLLEYSRAECQRIFVGKECGRHSFEEEDIIRLMLGEVRKGHLVVRLKGGDPGVFGRGGEEAEALAREGISFEIVPGVTAGVGVAAYAGVPLTHRDYASSVRFSIGRSAGKATGETRVLYMAGKNIAAATVDLLASGLAAETPALAVEAGTWAKQRSQVTTLGRLAQDVHLDSPLLIIIGDVVRCHEQMNWFERRPLFGKRILVPRSRDHEGKLAAALDEAGGEGVEYEPVSLVPEATLPEMVSKVGQFREIHFGDPQAVGMFMDVLRDARLLGGRRVSAAAHFTAAALERRGIVADSVGSPGEDSLLWLGSGRPPEGKGAVHHPVYREVLREDERSRVESLELHGAAFPSSASVRRSVALLGPDLIRRLPIFSIGPETTLELKRQGLVPQAEASPSTFPGMVDAVVRHFTERPVLCRENSIS
jgi:uroporphyrinogen III methyltransferase/synthase